MLNSCVCTQGQLQSETFRQWVVRIKESPAHMHRKIWEWCFISQALAERGLLAPGKRGLGFAVGQEPLVALFASYGCEVLATDLDEQSAARSGWVQTDQHASSLGALNKRGICPDDLFRQRVRFRVVDMNALPGDLAEQDFLWSSCSIEHLGSIEAAYLFMRRMTAFLKPGGVAVHTTEFNVSSEEDTLTTGPNVLFRKQDLVRLRSLLEADGHRVAPLDFHRGSEPADLHVDEPPYNHNPHLNLRIGPYVSTSIGLIVTAGPRPRQFLEREARKAGRWRWLLALREAVGGPWRRAS